MLELMLCLLVLAVLAAIAIPSYHQSMVRPKVRYVFSCFSSFGGELREQLQANQSLLLPQQFPTHFLHPEKAEGTLYADPFDTKKRTGVERLYCKTHPLYGNGELVDFNFWGNGFKYRRISDLRALVYSFGPDEDDDLATLRNADLEKLTTATSQQRLVAYNYDLSNGTVSDGDCWRLIDLDDLL
jgi:hypothetical protein